MNITSVSMANLWELFGERHTEVDDYGEPHEGPSPFISLCAVMADGSRFVHNHKFDSRCEFNTDKAYRFCDRVSKAGEINPEHWLETYPVYGSERSRWADAELLWGR